jgi:hypothetical protein
LPAEYLAVTNKFARRFVIGGNVIVRMIHSYFMNKAPDGEMPFASQPGARTRRLKMRKTILTILGSALLAASTVQIAAAAEHHKARKVYRAPAPVTEEFRNSNAYWPAPPVDPGWMSRYENGAESAPAGH